MFFTPSSVLRGAEPVPGARAHSVPVNSHASFRSASLHIPKGLRTAGCRQRASESAHSVPVNPQRSFRSTQLSSQITTKIRAVRRSCLVLILLSGVVGTAWGCPAAPWGKSFSYTSPLGTAQVPRKSPWGRVPAASPRYKRRPAFHESRHALDSNFSRSRLRSPYINRTRSITLHRGGLDEVRCGLQFSFPDPFRSCSARRQSAALAIEPCLHLKPSAAPQQYRRLLENAPAMHRDGAAPQPGDPLTPRRTRRTRPSRTSWRSAS